MMKLSESKNKVVSWTISATFLLSLVNIMFCLQSYPWHALILSQGVNTNDAITCSYKKECVYIYIFYKTVHVTGFELASLQFSESGQWCHGLFTNIVLRGSSQWSFVIVWAARLITADLATQYFKNKIPPLSRLYPQGTLVWMFLWLEWELGGVMREYV